MHQNILFIEHEHFVLSVRPHPLDYHRVWYQTVWERNTGYFYQKTYSVDNVKDFVGLTHHVIAYIVSAGARADLTRERVRA